MFTLKTWIFIKIKKNFVVESLKFDLIEEKKYYYYSMIKIQWLYEEQTKMHTGIDKIQISSQHTHIGLEF